MQPPPIVIPVRRAGSVGHLLVCPSTQTAAALPGGHVDVDVLLGAMDEHGLAPRFELQRSTADSLFDAMVQSLGIAQDHPMPAGPLPLVRPLADQGIAVESTRLHLGDDQPRWTWLGESTTSITRMASQLRIALGRFHLQVHPVHNGLLYTAPGILMVPDDLEALPESILDLPGHTLVYTGSNRDIDVQSLHRYRTALGADAHHLTAQAV